MPATLAAPAPIPAPAGAHQGTLTWFARFNERALERGLGIAADLPSVPELRDDARRHQAQGNSFLADYNNSIADLLAVDVRLLGLRAIVTDYSTHPDRAVVRMHAHDYRKALLAHVGKLECAA
jgi:hypothetical protein